MVALFKFLAELTGLTNFLVRRRAAKNDNPIHQASIAKDKVEKEILTNDADAANRRLDATLDRLRNKANGDKQ